VELTAPFVLLLSLIDASDKTEETKRPLSFCS